MGKKIWYSTPLKMYWSEVYPIQKKITPEFTDEQIYKCLVYQNMTAPIIPPETTFERENFRIGLDLWWDDCNKNFLHIFFIDKKLENILENIFLHEIDGIKKYLVENGNKKILTYTATKESVNFVSYSFGIHIPYETEGYAFQINIFQNGDFEVVFFHRGICGRLTEAMFKDLKNKTDEKSSALKNYFRLAVNTIAYMKVFPDCVVDGVPKITIDRNEKRTANNITLKISDKISEDTVINKRATTPHKRNWYIKYLKSDFYTKKRGELILVRETMVNGKAKTYYTASDLDKDVDL